MRQKPLKLSALLLLGLGLTGLQAQTMYVTEKSGTQTAYALSSIRKMTFSGGNATIQKTDNSTGVYAISGLSYLNFTDLSTGITESTMQLGVSNLITYPNPVKELLNIDLSNLPAEGTISILTLDGKMIQTLNINGNSLITLNISNLVQGIYLCRYSNAEVIKTVKIIKQ